MGAISQLLGFLFSPGATVVVSTFGWGIGFTLAVASQSRNIRLSHRFFGVAWVWTFGCISEKIMFSNLPLKTSIPLAFALTGLTGVAALLSYKWVERNHAETKQVQMPATPQPSTPDPQLASAISEETGQKILRSIGDLNTAQATKHEPSSPYLARILILTYSNSRNAASMFWTVPVVLNPYIVPVNMAIRVRVINNRPVATFIDRIATEAQTVRGEWILLNTIHTVGSGVYMGPREMCAPIPQEDLFYTFLERGTPIQPNETLQGWMLFRYPKDHPDAKFNGQVRMKVFDVAGNVTEINNEDVKRAGHDASSGGYQTRTPPNTNLSALPVRVD